MNSQPMQNTTRHVERLADRERRKLTSQSRRKARKPERYAEQMEGFIEAGVWPMYTP